jgi:hypothetical protein
MIFIVPPLVNPVLPLELILTPPPIASILTSIAPEMSTLLSVQIATPVEALISTPPAAAILIAFAALAVEVIFTFALLDLISMF